MAKNTFNAEQFLADKDTSLAALGQRVQDYGSYLLSLQVGPLFDAHAAQLLTLAESAKAGFISEKDYDRFIQRTEQVLGGAKNILRFQAYDLFDPQALEIFDFMESKLPDYHRKPFYSGFAGLPLYEREIETYMNNTPRPPGSFQEVQARPYQLRVDKLYTLEGEWVLEEDGYCCLTTQVDRGATEGMGYGSDSEPNRSRNGLLATWKATAEASLAKQGAQGEVIVTPGECFGQDRISIRVPARDFAKIMPVARLNEPNLIDPLVFEDTLHPAEIAVEKCDNHRFLISYAGVAEEKIRSWMKGMGLEHATLEPVTGKSFKVGGRDFDVDGDGPVFNLITDRQTFIELFTPFQRAASEHRRIANRGKQMELG